MVQSINPTQKNDETDGLPMPKPMEALIDTASYYLGLENFSMQQVLEARIME